MWVTIIYVVLHCAASKNPLILVYLYSHTKSKKSLTNNTCSYISLFRTKNLPQTYSLIGFLLTGEEGLFTYMTSMLAASKSSTVTVQLPLVIGGGMTVVTANPEITRHVLKTRFSNYEKGTIFSSTWTELFGRTLLIVDGDEWHSQHHFASPTFRKASLRAAMEAVVEQSISTCLLPAMTVNAHDVVDLQDIFQRFNFDTTCKMAFGYDPGCLSRTTNGNEILEAFKQAFSICCSRTNSIFPFSTVWKIEQLLNVGSQRQLMGFVHTIRESALCMILEKKEKLKSYNDDNDFLARALRQYNGDDAMVSDMIAGFIFAGYETLSSALTWFFWLVSTNPEVEEEILREIKRVEEAKDMAYTQAALYESMRLYPPVPLDVKVAVDDDVLPDGTPIQKGMQFMYSMYSMGRSESIWGPDWAQYNPRRWLRQDHDTWTFCPRDPYTYTVFNAGPRMCLGMDMALIHMKTIVARVLPNFKIMPSLDGDPVYVSDLTSKMKGGLLVTLEQRIP